MTKTITQNRESGFTLLELLLVIGVAALLLIGGIATYRLVSDGNKATETTRLLLTIRQETQAMAQQQGGIYTGIVFDSATASTTSPLIVGGILRDQQRNPFNGTIKIDPVANGLQVALGQISKSACIKVIQSINNPNEVVSVGAGSASYSAAAGTIPVTAANAAAACSAPTNVITWVFP